MVEHQPSKLRVAGSIPVSRSIMIDGIADLSSNNWSSLSLLSDRFFFTPVRDRARSSATGYVLNNSSGVEWTG